MYYLCCMCIDFYDLSALCGFWFVVFRKEGSSGLMAEEAPTKNLRER